MSYGYSRRRYLVGLLTVLLSIPIMAVGVAQPPRTPAEAPANVQIPLTEANLALNPTYTTWFDRRLAVAEAAIEQQEDAADDLALLLALSAIGFGALITTLVVFFALRTERTAAAAASTAATEAAQREIQSGKEELETILEAAKRIRREAEDVLLGIRQDRGEAAQHVATLRAAIEIARKEPAAITGEEGSARLTTEEENELRTGADIISRTPVSSWTIDDYKVLMRSEGSPDRLAELALMLRYRHQDDYAEAYSINAEAVAFGRKGQTENSRAKYRQVVDKFWDSEDTEVKNVVVTSLANIGMSFKADGKMEDALHAFDRVIKRFSDEDDTRIKQRAAVVRLNRARTLNESGRRQEAEEALADITDSLLDDNSIEIRELERRLFWNGLIYSLHWAIRTAR